MKLGKNLRSRVFTACIVISIAPLIVVAYQGYHCGRMAIMDLTHLHVLSVAEARHAMIATWLNERIDDISALVSLPVVVNQVELIEKDPHPGPVGVLEGILRSTQSHGNVYESLTVFDADWNILAESEAGLHANGAFATADFREHVRNADHVYFGEAHIHDGHEVGIHVGSPITSDHGDIVGYLVANMNITASLTPLLQDRSGLWQTGKAYIIDSSLRVLTEPFTTGDAYAFRAQSSPQQNLGTGGAHENVQVYSDFLGHDVIGAALPFVAYGWAVVVEIDTDESMEWVRVLLLRATYLLIAVLVGVVVVSIWLSRLLGRPLMQLAAVAHRISAGHTHERLGAMNMEEAEEVRCAFNRMLDELRDKEEEIVRSATLATVGELTSRVVHEMRNPLSSVKMNFQALQRSVEPSSDNLELAEIAFGQLTRLESMLNELLQYGRPLELSREYVNVESLIHAAETETRESSLEKQVEIVVAIDPVLTEISVDPEQFKRVLVNLIRNAIDASPRGAQVEIQARPSGEQSEDVVIEVADSGVGIREEHAEMLFKPFFTTKSEGIGLGLANVKKIVGLHAGQIRARNAPGVGAVFTLSVPTHGPVRESISPDGTV